MAPPRMAAAKSVGMNDELRCSRSARMKKSRAMIWFVSLTRRIGFSRSAGGARWWKRACTG